MIDVVAQSHDGHVPSDVGTCEFQWHDGRVPELRDQVHDDLSASEYSPRELVTHILGDALVIIEDNAPFAYVTATNNRNAVPDEGSDLDDAVRDWTLPIAELAEARFFPITH